MLDTETRPEQTEWRVGELRGSNGTRLKFWQTGNGAYIFLECPGMCAAEPGKTEKLNNLVQTILRAEGGKGVTSLTEHEIKLKPNAKTDRQAPRRMSPKVLEVAQENVKKMLAEDIIESSESD